MSVQMKSLLWEKSRKIIYKSFVVHKYIIVAKLRCNKVIGTKCFMSWNGICWPCYYLTTTSTSAYHLLIRAIPSSSLPFPSWQWVCPEFVLLKNTPIYFVIFGISTRKVWTKQPVKHHFMYSASLNVKCFKNKEIRYLSLAKSWKQFELDAPHFYWILHMRIHLNLEQIIRKSSFNQNYHQTTQNKMEFDRCIFPFKLYLQFYFANICNNH